MAKLLKLTPEARQAAINKFATSLSNIDTYTGKISYNHAFSTDAKATVWFTQDSWAKMIALIHSVGEKEVGWHGIVQRAEEAEGYNYVVTDLLVYPQTVSGATVDTDQEKYQNWLNRQSDEVFNHIRGHFHSHVNMPCNPSSTDDQHVQDLVKQIPADDFYVFMIWNKKMEFTARIYDLRANLFFETTDVDVKTIGDVGLQEFIQNAKSMIEIKTYSYGASNYNKGASAGQNKGSATGGPPLRPVMGGGWRGGYPYDDNYGDIYN